MYTTTLKCSAAEKLPNACKEVWLYCKCCKTVFLFDWSLDAKQMFLIRICIRCVSYFWYADEGWRFQAVSFHFISLFEAVTENVNHVHLVIPCFDPQKQLLVTQTVLFCNTWFTSEQPHPGLPAWSCSCGSVPHTYHMHCTCLWHIYGIQLHDESVLQLHPLLDKHIQNNEKGSLTNPETTS